MNNPHFVQAQRDPTLTPPNWYVTNGVAIIGPVDTELLLQGITHGKITESCMVRQSSWKSWRGLNEIRERAMFRDAPLTPWRGEPEGGPTELAEITNLTATNDDFGERLLLAMSRLVRQMHADVGLVHRVREPYVGLITSCAHGAGSERRLGEIMRSYDPALLAARSGATVLGHPLAGPAERAVASRIAASPPAVLRGVAMVPVTVRSSLLAMIELGRYDYAFRRADGERLASIAASAAQSRDVDDLLRALADA